MNAKNARRSAFATASAGRPKTTAAEAALQRQATTDFLMSPGRWGLRKIQTLSWTRLAVIYGATRPGSAVRKAINAEARRCGYTPSVILALHAE